MESRLNSLMGLVKKLVKAIAQPAINNYKGNKWTATQGNATGSFYFGTALDNSIKNNAYLAIPFFACPSPSLSLSLSSEEDEKEEGASVDAERVA